MRAVSRAVFLLAMVAVRPASSQWHVGVELGILEFRGASRDTAGSPGGTSLRPDHAVTYGVRVGRQFGRVGVALRALAGTPGIAAVGSGLTLTDRTTGGFVEVVPLVSIRLWALGSSGAVRAEAGPCFDMWNVGDVGRSRVAALGALVYEWPVAGRFTSSIRAEATGGASVFDDQDLPPELARRPLWRYGVTLGLRYRL